MKRLPFRGTLLNATLVALGGLVGMFAGGFLGSDIQTLVVNCMGLVTTLLAVKMALQTKNFVIVAVAVAGGALVGTALHLPQGVEWLANWAKSQVGGGSNFTPTLITTSVLYCVGPMTLLGCIEDGLEGNIEILTMKSIMDGITAVFFAVGTGAALLVTAIAVLLFQSGLSAAARLLKPLAQDEELLHSMTGTGGALLLATGLNLLGVAHFKTETLMPALAIAPMLTVLERRLTSKRVG